MKAQAGAGRPGMCQCEFSTTEKFLLFMDVRAWHPSHPRPLVWDPLHPTLGVRLQSVAFQSQWSGSSKNPEHLPPVWLFPREAAIFISPATLHTFYSTWPTTLAISDETGVAATHKLAWSNLSPRRESHIGWCGWTTSVLTAVQKGGAVGSRCKSRMPFRGSLNKER